LTHVDANSGQHKHFQELAAAATCGALTAEESESLERHLLVCEECCSVMREYHVLTSEGFAILAQGYEHPEESEGWNEGATRRRLLASAQEAGQRNSIALGASVRRPFMPQFTWVAALAACLLAAVGIGGRLFTKHRTNAPTQAVASEESRLIELLAARKSAESALAAQAGDLVRLQAEGSTRRLAFEELQSRFEELQRRLQEERATAQAGMGELSQGKARAETELSHVTQQREQLSNQLRSARQAYDLVETELVNLRAERDSTKLQLASLETRVGELNALEREQEGVLKNNEQYLSSDRDIRDLMSARNLYIADVFDVDSHSRTRKPFGRVFFTRGKSLLFYAFDLDQQPQLNNANTFQVWGQKDTDQSEPARVVDLGILYLDSEANRRWLLRFDNSQTLSQIDAVFVTVEPHGGSRKPTGKPFLFATLRKEANHP
jgi:anti-sigma-K factor RskA